MTDNISTLTTTPLEMEVIQSEHEGKTLSFRAPEGYFILTDRSEDPAGDSSHYHEVNDTSFEGENISLYFDSDNLFQGIYDVVTFNWPLDGEIAGFLAESLILSKPLRLALNADGRSRLQ